MTIVKLFDAVILWHCSWRLAFIHFLMNWGTQTLGFLMVDHFLRCLILNLRVSLISSLISQHNLLLMMFLV